MNKTTIKVLQELIRDKDFSVEGTAKKLNKAKTTIYDCISTLRKKQILNKQNRLKNNELAEAYKKLFLTFPYDFSFLTTKNMAILLLLDKEISFTVLIKKSKRSRFTVNRLVRHLRSRGFTNKKNKLISPPELLKLLIIIKKYKYNKIIQLPENAVIIGSNEKRDLILAKITLPLHKTAFSAFQEVISPHNYYTTKKRITRQDIFTDAKTISRTKREQLMAAFFYKKNRKNLKKDKDYEMLIQSKEFKEFEDGI